MYNYYDKILLTEDFNTEIYDHYLETFLYEHERKSLVKEKKLSCIDSFLTNNALSF